MRNYRPDEIAGGIIQGDSSAIISPSALPGTAWAFLTPTRGDKILADGRIRNIESVETVTIASSVVRYNFQLRG